MSNQSETPQTKKGRGRPKGSTDNKVKKIKLKPSPKTAKEDFYKKYKDIGLLAVYGVDEFTKELIMHFWKDPNQDIVATDPVDQELANLNRHMSGLSFSMYRWEVQHHVGFIEEGYYPVVVVAKKYWDTVIKLPNPEEVELVCLEDY
jgi:hypothetical protein